MWHGYLLRPWHCCMTLCSLFIPFLKLPFLLKDHQKFGIQLWPKVKETWIWSASKLVKNVWLLLLPPMKWQNQSRNQKNIKWRRTKSRCNCLDWTFTQYLIYIAEIHHCICLIHNNSFYSKISSHGSDAIKGVKCKGTTHSAGVENGGK